MKSSELAESPHARRHAAKPLQDIDVMEALIQQYAAAFAFPGGAPIAAGVVGFGAIPIGINPADAHECSKLAVVDDFLNFLIAWLDAKLKHAREDHARMILMRSNQSFGIGFMR